MKKWFRKLKAKILRTFVADCPLCHKHFYGHYEHAKQVKIKNKTYRFICHKCKQQHKL